MQFKAKEDKEEGNEEEATGSLVLGGLDHQHAAAAAVSSVLVEVFTLRPVKNKTALKTLIRWGRYFRPAPISLCWLWKTVRYCGATATALTAPFSH